MLMPWMRLKSMNISILLILPSRLVSQAIIAFQMSWQVIGGATPIIRHRSRQAQKNSFPSNCPEKLQSYRWQIMLMLFMSIWSCIWLHPPEQSTATQPGIDWQWQPGLDHLLQKPPPKNPPPPQPPQPPPNPMFPHILFTIIYIEVSLRSIKCLRISDSRHLMRVKIIVVLQAVSLGTKTAEMGQALQSNSQNLKLFLLQKLQGVVVYKMSKIVCLGNVQNRSQNAEESPHSSHAHSPHAHAHSHAHASSPADVHHHAGIDALDPLEQHEHLGSAHSSVTVVVAGHDCVPDVLVVHGRSNPHHQAEVSVGVEKFLSLQLSAHVHVVSLEDEFDVVPEHLVVDVRVPSTGVVDVVKSVHSLVVHACVAPPVEAHASVSTCIGSGLPSNMQTVYLSTNLRAYYSYLSSKAALLLVLTHH